MKHVKMNFVQQSLRQIQLHWRISTITPNSNLQYCPFQLVQPSHLVPSSLSSVTVSSHLPYKEALQSLPKTPDSPLLSTQKSNSYSRSSTLSPSDLPSQPTPPGKPSNVGPDETLVSKTSLCDSEHPPESDPKDLGSITTKEEATYGCEDWDEESEAWMNELRTKEPASDSVALDNFNCCPQLQSSMLPRLGLSPQPSNLTTK